MLLESPTEWEMEDVFGRFLGFLRDQQKKKCWEILQSVEHVEKKSGFSCVIMKLNSAPQVQLRTHQLLGPSCWCTSLHLKRTLFNDYSFSKNAGLLNVLKAVMKFADITAAARMTPTDHPATL